LTFFNLIYSAFITRGVLSFVVVDFTTTELLIEVDCMLTMTGGNRFSEYNGKKIQQTTKAMKKVTAAA